MKKTIRNLVLITAIAGLLYTHGMDLIMTCFALGYYAYKGFPQEVYLDVAFQDNVFFAFRLISCSHQNLSQVVTS